jgi:Mg-chelatase subunit ChlD
MILIIKDLLLSSFIREANMVNENKTGLQISQKSDKTDISIVNGGLKIAASEKPVSANLENNWGRVYILLDCSGSMKGKKIDQAKQGVLNFAGDAFKKGYRVGFIRFSDNAELLCEPTQDIEILRNKIQDLRAVGSTNMAEAIKLAHSKLKQLTGARAMVIATDGMPDNVKNSLMAAENAKKDGIEILTIGTDDAKTEFLNKIASRTELSAKVTSDQFAQAISNAYLLLSRPRSIIPK